jgi:pyroglutamyl-peptidase
VSLGDVTTGLEHHLSTGKMPRLLLTGFSSFHGVNRNPTEEIILSLSPEYSDCDIATKVLEVSVDGVSEFQSGVRETEAVDDLILIHLGVDSNATEFKIEKYAYNNMTFRVADERGYQPNECKIYLTEEFDDKICSSIDCEKLLDGLRADGWTVNISTDPGRFLCNYVYYNSLQLQSSKRALFVHVPPAAIVPIEKQVEFVRALIRQVFENCKH